MPGKQLTRTEDLPEGGAMAFTFRRRGRLRHGFLIRFGNRFHAYENECRHLPLTLDYDDQRFFTPDGRHLRCQTHGALFQPNTGYCVAGPCAGLSLHPLKLRVKDGIVYLLGPGENP